MRVVFIVVFILMASQVGAQTSGPTGSTQGYDYNQTMQSATLRDHIAVDLGVWIPFGELKDRGGIEPGFGLMVHFWKSVTDNTFLIVSVGNSWMSMSGKVQTDTGLVDLSPLSFNASPLLGGGGHVFHFGEFRAFATIHAGATIIGLTSSQGLPAAFIEDNTFFTVGGSVGGGYAVAPWASVLFQTRYLQLFGENFSHLDFSLGASFQW